MALLLPLSEALREESRDPIERFLLVGPLAAEHEPGPLRRSPAQDAENALGVDLLAVGEDQRHPAAVLAGEMNQLRRGASVESEAVHDLESELNHANHSGAREADPVPVVPLGRYSGGP